MAQRRIGISVPGRESSRVGSQRILLVCCGLAALLLGLKIQSVISGRASGLDRAVVVATAPVPIAIEHGASGLASLLQVFRLPAILHENEQLKLEKQFLQGQLADTQSAAAENDTLRKQMGLGSVDGCRAIHAAVIARPYDLWLDNVILGAGSEQGIVPGCLVANASGLVGKVTETGQGFCRAELVSSPKFRLAGVAKAGGDKPGDYEGLVRGVATGELAFDYIAALANINVGDKVFSRGGVAVPEKAGVAADPRTPKGIYIGQVVEKTTEQGFLRIKLQPAIDINRLDALTVYAQ